MKTKFLCPFCRVTLSIRENVIFKVRTEDHKMGILILNPELGSYKYSSLPDLNFKNGERIEFICPICCEQLSIKNSTEDWVGILMIQDKKKEYHFYFSSIAGEHSKFIIEENNVVHQSG